MTKDQVNKNIGRLVRYEHPGSYSAGSLFVLVGVRKVRLGSREYYQAKLQDRNCDSCIICALEHIEETKEAENDE